MNGSVHVCGIYGTMSELNIENKDVCCQAYNRKLMNTKYGKGICWKENEPTNLNKLFNQMLLKTDQKVHLYFFNLFLFTELSS